MSPGKWLAELNSSGVLANEISGQWLSLSGPVRSGCICLRPHSMYPSMANNKLNVEGVLMLEQPFVRVRLFRTSSDPFIKPGGVSQ